MKPKVRIEVAPQARNSRVWLNDIEITETLEGLNLNAYSGRQSALTLKLKPTDIEITGNVGRVIREVSKPQKNQED
jgi:hypothetical protein